MQLNSLWISGNVSGTPSSLSISWLLFHVPGLTLLGGVKTEVNRLNTGKDCPWTMKQGCRPTPISWAKHACYIKIYLALPSSIWPYFVLSIICLALSHYILSLKKSITVTLSFSTSIYQPDSLFIYRTLTSFVLPDQCNHLTIYQSLNKLSKSMGLYLTHSASLSIFQPD